MKTLSAGEIRGTWATLLSAWAPDGSLDIGRVRAELDALVAAGVDGIYSHGTAGEFHCQTEDEFDQVAVCLAATCTPAGMPFQIGASHMAPQISLERVKRTRPLAPSAYQFILPDWFPVSFAEAVAFVEGLAEAADGIGLVLYNPPHAKRVWRPVEIGRLRPLAAALIPEFIPLV